MEENKKSFFGKVWETIIGIFKDNYEGWFKKIWEKSVPDDMKEKVTLVVKIMEIVKQQADNPIVRLIVEQIPGEWADDVLEFISERLEVYLEKYKDLTDTENIQLMAANLTKDLTGMSKSQAIVTTEIAYKNYQAKQLEA